MLGLGLVYILEHESKVFLNSKRAGSGAYSWILLNRMMYPSVVSMEKLVEGKV